MYSQPQFKISNNGRRGLYVVAWFIVCSLLYPGGDLYNTAPVWQNEVSAINLMSTRLHSHICYFVLSDTGRVMVVYSNRHNIIDKLIASFHWYRFSFDRIASSASLSIILFYQWFSLGRFSLFLSPFFCIIIYLQHLCYLSISGFHPRSFWPFWVYSIFCSSFLYLSPFFRIASFGWITIMVFFSFYVFFIVS